MKVYVIILNFNNWQDTVQSVLSVLNGSYADFQIVIIDNNSQNNSQKMILNWLNGDLNIEPDNIITKEDKPKILKGPLPYIIYNEGKRINRDYKKELSATDNFNSSSKGFNMKNPILFIQTGLNLGFSGGNNVFINSLINSKESAFIFLLNPDVILDRNVIHELCNRYKSKINSLFISGISIFNYFDLNQKLSNGGARLYKSIGFVRHVTKYNGKIDYIYGGALFTNISTFKNIGPLPEEYFLYWEEADWCKKAKLNGAKYYLSDKSKCYDKVGSSIGRGYIAEYYFTRNSFVFYRKYYPYFIINLFLFQIVRLFIKILKFKPNQAKGIFDALNDFVFNKRRNAIKEF